MMIITSTTRGSIFKNIQGMKIALKMLNNMDIKDLQKLLQNNTLSEDSKEIIKAIINIKQGKIN